MYQLKQKKPRYLIKQILNDLYDWVVDEFESEENRYAKWSGDCSYGSTENYPDIVNYHELNSNMYYAIKWELQEEFENEIRSCISRLSDKDAERIIKWMGLYINDRYDYPRDGLEDDDGFIEAITKKFIYRKLNIKE
jgi:hypothetical protein